MLAVIDKRKADTPSDSGIQSALTASLSCVLSRKITYACRTFSWRVRKVLTTSSNPRVYHSHKQKTQDSLKRARHRTPSPEKSAYQSIVQLAQCTLLSVHRNLPCCLTPPPLPAPRQILLGTNKQRYTLKDRVFPSLALSLSQTHTHIHGTTSPLA